MSKISVNSNVMLRGIKIYAEGGALYADMVGEAMSNIGPVNFNFNKFQLDFNVPEQAGVASFCFRDGNGRVGYNFNFGDVLYVNEDEVANVVPAEENMQEDASEESNVEEETDSV